MIAVLLEPGDYELASMTRGVDGRLGANQGLHRTLRVTGPVATPGEGGVPPLPTVIGAVGLRDDGLDLPDSFAPGLVPRDQHGQPAARPDPGPGQRRCEDRRRQAVADARPTTVRRRVHRRSRSPAGRHRSIPESASGSSWRWAAGATSRGTTSSTGAATSDPFREKGLYATFDVT